MVKKSPVINKRQIMIGTQIEMEHTSDRRVARKIACDHLREHPSYYIELRKMKKGLKIK